MPLNAVPAKGIDSFLYRFFVCLSIIKQIITTLILPGTVRFVDTVCDGMSNKRTKPKTI